MSTLESAAREYLLGRASSETLVNLAIATPTSGGPDDHLVGVILTFGNADASTEEDLTEALVRYLNRPRTWEVRITEIVRPETRDDAATPLVRDSVWRGRSTSETAAFELAWTDWDTKYDERPTARLEIREIGELPV